MIDLQTTADAAAFDVLLTTDGEDPLPCFARLLVCSTPLCTCTAAMFLVRRGTVEGGREPTGDDDMEVWPVQVTFDIATEQIDLQNTDAFEDPDLAARWRQAASGGLDDRGQAILRAAFAAERQRLVAAAPAWVTDPRAQRIRRLLAEAGERLSRAHRQEIVAADDIVVDVLMNVLEDEPPESLDDYSREHAAWLLGQLKAVRAVPVLIDTLYLTEPGDVLYDNALFATAAMGAAALEPVLEACREAEPGSSFQSATIEVLGRLGVQDTRVVELLMTLIADDFDIAVSALARYGEAESRAALAGAIDAFEPGESPQEDEERLDLLVDALNALGGRLTEAQRDRLTPMLPDGTPVLREAPPWSGRGAGAAAQGGVWGEPYVKPVRPGRNEPCWCGSGRKYKKCCLAQDAVR